MLKSLARDRLLLLLVVIAVTLKLFSLNEARVEQYYTNGIYPFISSGLRLLFGWIPFSIGDLLYFTAFIYLVAKAWKWLKLLAKRQIKEYLSWILFGKFLKLVLWIYIIFNLFWGLNYNRQGIATAFNLEVRPYTTQELYDFTWLLQQRLCEFGEKTDTLNRLRYDDKDTLFRGGLDAYETIKKQYPFLDYNNPSLKPSILTPLGHYFGFTGYYNPFTGEAQMKTTVPVFVKPFVLCHEIGHQLGFAKENEANMVGFLVASKSSDPEFSYSAYWELYTYAIRELSRKDPASAWLLMSVVHPAYKRDYREYYNYLTNNSNMVEPYVSKFYDNYLRLNNQPKGKMTYNEVTAWLIAYMKKYGKEQI